MSSFHKTDPPTTSSTSRSSAATSLSASTTAAPHAAFSRQAMILRKNLWEWDRLLRTPRGEEWPTMVGRCHAAYHQTVTLHRAMDDVYEHFVYVPIRATTNPQDIPFFLSTRLESTTTTTNSLAGGTSNDDAQDDMLEGKDPVQVLTEYEAGALQVAAEYEENMVRFG
jgi:hypothetical protein